MKSTPNRPGAPARAGSNGRSPAPVRPARPGGQARTANGRAVTEFVQGVISEMRRVTWPTREEWIAATILTIALVVGVGVFTYLVDLILGWIFSFLTGGAR
jgi:preprotein translocase SecE subunit